MSVSNPTAPTCFIDTNIWLYAFITGSNPSKTTIAKTIIQSEPRIVVSTQVINEISVNLIKKVAFPEGDLRQLIASFYRRYQVVEFGHAILVRASEVRERHQLSFWDSLIVASALAAGASILYTEDMHDELVVEGQLTITNPFKSTP
jgi:predicted nucleic acid-binding protein